MNRSAEASCLVMAVSIVVIVACGTPAPNAGSPEALYIELGCAKCHGDNRQGLRSGPPLDALGERWKEESLMEYFSDPKAVMEGNPRLKYMAESYPIVMPGYPDTIEEDLRRLAKFILEG